MTPFEAELKRALARREPDDGFTERVLARAAAEEAPPNRRRWFGWARTWVVAAAMALLLLPVGGVIYRHHERVVRGQEAKQKLLLALQIAGSKLQQVQKQVLKVEATEME